MQHYNEIEEIVNSRKIEELEKRIEHLTLALESMAIRYAYLERIFHDSKNINTLQRQKQRRA